MRGACELTADYRFEVYCPTLIRNAATVGSVKCLFVSFHVCQHRPPKVTPSYVRLVTSLPYNFVDLGPDILLALCSRPRFTPDSHTMRRARRLTGYSKVRTSDFILDPSSTHRITQYIAEDSLEGMKDVVRKKLGLATSASIYFSQLRDESVDLEDGMFCHRKASIPCSVFFSFLIRGRFRGISCFRAYYRGCSDKCVI